MNVYVQAHALREPEVRIDIGIGDVGNGSYYVLHVGDVCLFLSDKQVAKLQAVAASRPPLEESKT